MAVAKSSSGGTARVRAVSRHDHDDRDVRVEEGTEIKIGMYSTHLEIPRQSRDGVDLRGLISVSILSWVLVLFHLRFGLISVSVFFSPFGYYLRFGFHLLLLKKIIPC